MSAFVWYSWNDSNYNMVRIATVYFTIDIFAFTGFSLFPFFLVCLLWSPYPKENDRHVFVWPSNAFLSVPSRMSLTTRRVMLSEWVNGVKLSTLPKEVPMGCRGPRMVPDDGWWLLMVGPTTDFCWKQNGSGCFAFSTDIRNWDKRPVHS